HLWRRAADRGGIAPARRRGPLPAALSVVRAGGGVGRARETCAVTSDPTAAPDLQLYDTRRRAVVPFEPLVAGKASIYTCGPTVYAPQTLGNMRSQFTPDILRRVLLADGYDVTFVTNITDVGHLVGDGDEGDDKVEKAAAQQGTTAEEIAAHWTDQWATDRRRLGMLEPDHLPKATEYLPQQIELIQQLEAKGHTYRIDD